ncbi:class I SAM-dependent DNA methyltransferase [Lactovum odontotermitis]
MTFYEDFSKVYDQVMDQSLYDDWLAFTERHLPKTAHSIFELACGSGALSVRLAKRGYDVTALDISEDMLKLATAKAQKAGVEIAWMQGDMRYLPPFGKFDAVTCYSDSLCYLADLDELKQTFDGVYELLGDGGTFIFDVHSTYQVDEVFPGYAYHENEEDFAFLWDSYKGEQPHSVEHQLSFFIKDKDTDGKFVRKDELHVERTYEIDTFKSALSKFSELQVFADFEDKRPAADSARWFFVCKKKDRQN